jgi:hypothetical protein
MSRYYVLRNETGEFFAGYKCDTLKNFYLRPTFVAPQPGNSTQAMIIHEDDLAETKADLAKSDIEVEQIQVG